MLEIEGQVTLQLSAKSVGLFEAFYNSIKPVDLIKYKFPIQSTGKISMQLTCLSNHPDDGKSNIPFEFDLKPLAGQELFETYHGVYINVVYTIKAQIIRKYLGKDLNSSLEFIVQLPPVRPLWFVPHLLAQNSP